MYYTARQQHESLTPTPPPMRRARTRNSYSPVTIVCFSVVVMHCTAQHYQMHHQCSTAQQHSTEEGATLFLVGATLFLKRGYPIILRRGYPVFKNCS